MSFPGPAPVSPITPAIGQEIGLRAFQRITAQVLSVTGTTAVLSIEGYPVVAQLTSADQAAALLSQRTAQFIVTELSSQAVTLKFVRNEQNLPAINGTVFNGPELAARILEQINLPLTGSNLMMARSVLKQHLPVTPQLMNELLGALSGGPWGEADAELAAAMPRSGGEYFYFVHSYYGKPAAKDLTLASCRYGREDFAAVIGNEDVFATQFHPEKSQAAGLRILKNFIRW